MARRTRKPLADSVADALQATRRTNWFHELPVKARREIEGIRLQWIAGEFVDGNGKRATPNAVAAAISASLNERKISSVGRQGVLAWLKQSRP